MLRVLFTAVMICVSLFFTAHPTLAHSGPPNLSSTFDIIQHRVFNQSCALQSCHVSSIQAGGLVLEEGQAYDNLFNVAPATPMAAATGKKRVAPGDLDKSFLWQKLNAMLAAGEGSPMPLGSNGFATSNPELTEVIRKWILAGAPEEGLVPGTGDIGGGGGGLQPTITPLPIPAPGAGYQVEIPAYPLGSRPELEGCVFARLPNETEIYVSGYEIAMRPGSHHFILYRYDGDACDRDGDSDGTPNCLDQDSGEAFPPQFLEDVGCNDKGPADRFRK